MHDFSCNVEISDIPPDGLERKLEADRAQRDNVANWLDVPEIRSLGGTIRLDRSGEILTVSGTIEGRFRRQCGLSLEMFEEEIVERFRFELTLKAPALEGSQMTAPLPNDLDMPDFWPEAVIDLGDILVQQASLAIMIHPRKPGAVALQEVAAQELPSPFAGLKEMVSKK